MLVKQHFDPAEYRDAMARYAGHVQIITTTVDKQRRGVTVTAACSVSDKPPSLLVCLNNTNPNNEIFWRSDVFALNSLGSHQQDLADAFSGRDRLLDEARFSRGDWTTLETGAPILRDAIVSFDCRLTDMKPMDTHTVLFGEVVAIHVGPRSPSLIYLDRGYKAL
ncbi:flavin reductase [Rhizobiaceae bacterium n13]|uniref:Flavin reductase n=1 Tax=Ferirhizobium litorale TaxID=2927786 RepID=A0AAE3QFA9_9HYPH|nr:flavin reductase [Fererhizobium litorale]MDI7863301.1 flavin reductase [Fererhizobium litorale]MDI7922965.1 flavin reductase [Fererhizobium litorale]